MAVVLCGSRCTDTPQQPANSSQFVVFGCRFECTDPVEVLVYLSSASATCEVVSQANAVQAMSSLSGVIWVTHVQLQDQMFNFIPALGQ